MTTTKSVPDSTRTRSANGWSAADGFGRLDGRDDAGVAATVSRDGQGAGRRLLVTGPLRLRVGAAEPRPRRRAAATRTCSAKVCAATLQRPGAREPPGHGRPGPAAQRPTSGRENSMNTKVTLVTAGASLVGSPLPGPRTGPDPWRYREHQRRQRRRPPGTEARPHALPLHRRHRRDGRRHHRRARSSPTSASSSSGSAPASSTSSR